MNHVTYECVMAHIGMSPDAKCKCVSARIRIWHTYEGVPHTNESCLTYEIVMAHVWKCQITYITQLFLT